MIRNPWEIAEAFSDARIDVFAKNVLGVTLHDYQIRWCNRSNKIINILDPSNQWGKTLVTSVKHIYQAVTKPKLKGRVSDYQAWMAVDYKCLNVGKTYEVAKGVYEAIHEMVEGEMLLPDGSTNKSLLKGWAVKRYQDVSNKAPLIEWWNGSQTLIRSYDELGSSFKRLKFAYISSDECGDIPELSLFLNGTMLPRTVYWKGNIDLIGTHQSKGIEYYELSQKAREDMEKNGEDAMYYVQTGSLYENAYMDPDHIKMIENIADEKLRMQIIYGQYVDAGDHFFSFEEVQNAFIDLPYDEESGFIEDIDEKGYYVMSVDLAATEDETAVSVIRYNNTIVRRGFGDVELPYKLVFHKAFKGKTIPVSMQYELIRAWYMEYKNTAKNTVLLFDAGSLGGKNAADAFRDLHGFEFPGLHKSYAVEKAYAIGSLKEVMGRNRKITRLPEGGVIDHVPNWGFLKMPHKIRELKRQFEIYALDDKRLKQDRMATIYMAIHWIEKRKPRTTHNAAVDMDIYSSTIPHHARQ